MNKLINAKFWLMLSMLTLVFGATNISAQRRAVKRKPVIKKRTVVRKPTVVQPRLYTVESGEQIRVRMNGELSSKTAQIGNTFTTTVTEPVYSNNGVVVIPVGSTVTGRVDQVQKAKKGGDPGAISVSFTEVRLPNGTRRAISGSLTDLDSKAAKSDNEGTASGDKLKHRKIIFIGGGAGGGAILGAAVGGGKGALIGAAIGAGAGFLGELLTKGEEAKVPSGTTFGVLLNRSVALPKFAEVERQ